MIAITLYYFANSQDYRPYFNHLPLLIHPLMIIYHVIIFYVKLYGSINLIIPGFFNSFCKPFFQTRFINITVWKSFTRISSIDSFGVPSSFRGFPIRNLSHKRDLFFIKNFLKMK